MIKETLKGFQYGIGFSLALCLFFGIIYAVGFHNANEIIGGMFQGNFSFNGTMNFTNSNLIVASATQICSGSSKGAIMYNDTDKGIYVCNGFSWKKSTQYYSASSCLNIYENGESNGDVLYNISPYGNSSIYEVYCDMANGGWTLIFSSQTVGGSADQPGTYDTNLQTLSPSNSMVKVWTHFDSVSAIKFSCDGNKDSSIDYLGIDTGNEIYNSIKSCSDGLCGGSASSPNLDDGSHFNEGTADDKSANPDFIIRSSGGGKNWGSYDDYPYSSTDHKDRCNDVSYRTRTDTPTTGSTSNAYFYIYVK